MNPNLILTITQGAQLVGTLAPIGFQMAQSIKQLLAKDSSLSVTIVALQGDTIRTADETLALIDAWNRAHPEAAPVP